MDKKQINIAFLIENDKIRSYRTRIFHKGNFELRSKTGKQSDLIITTKHRPEVDSFFRYSSKKKIKRDQHIEVESWTLSHRMAEMMNGMCLVPDYFPKGNLQSVNTQWTFSYKALLAHQSDVLLSRLEQQLLKKF